MGELFNQYPIAAKPKTGDKKAGFDVMFAAPGKVRPSYL
jgi:hypothetical protein